MPWEWGLNHILGKGARALVQEGRESESRGGLSEELEEGLEHLEWMIPLLDGLRDTRCAAQIAILQKSTLKLPPPYSVPVGRNP